MPRPIVGAPTPRFSDPMAVTLPKTGRLILISAVLLFLLLSAACRRRMAPPQPYLALVANQGERSIAVANLGSFKLARVIPLGFSPAKIISRPNHPEVYVTSLSGQVAIIRFPELAIGGSFETGPGPNELAFAPNGDAAYLLGNGGKTIFSVDCQSLERKVVFEAKDSLSVLALNAGGSRLLVVEGEKLLLINPQDGNVTGSADIGSPAGPLAIVPGGRKAFVAAAKTSEIAAVDLRGGQILSRIDVGSRPSLLVMKPDGGELFAFSAADSVMTILNASDNSVEESHPSGRDPAAAVFSRDSRWLYVANAGDGTVTRINVATREEFPARAGIKPTALALTPDGRFLAVVDSEGGRLSVLRAATGDLITSIPAGADPVSVAIPGWMGK